LSALRAPAADGADVAVPPLEEVGPLLATNRRRLHRPDLALLGRPLADLQRQARADVVAAARSYLAERGEPVPQTEPAHLLLAGHQPELFHPGVWVKNFALAGLARRHGAASLNLIVDNDAVKSTTLRVPAPPDDSGRPHLVRVPFDRWTGEVPWEERAVADPELFATFAERTGAVLRGWGYAPLLGPFWAEVRRQVARAGLSGSPGESFAAARRDLERAWGCANLELPLSRVCASAPFAWFAAHLLADLPAFRTAYNAVVRAYRSRHGIRGNAHPVPDLAEKDGWLETPFWGWRAGQPRRARLFARLAGARIELRATDPWPALPRAPQQCAAAWQALEGHGFKARSRALTTTLYARLFLAELFIHGIGGGKYDELTDELLRRFYGVEPPTFLVLSATCWLPLPATPVSRAERRRLAHALRDLHYNPQRHLGPEQTEPALAEAARLKQAWIERRPGDRAGRRQRFRVLRELTERLRAPLHQREQELGRELERLDRTLADNALLHRRDYSFCLYPESVLRPFCTRFLS
jgi:hypothetical protein